MSSFFLQVQSLLDQILATSSTIFALYLGNTIFGISFALWIVHKISKLFSRLE